MPDLWCSNLGALAENVFLGEDGLSALLGVRIEGLIGGVVFRFVAPMLRCYGCQA